MLLIVQSSLSGVAATVTGLRRAGLRADVTDRRPQPYGPVMAARARWFERRGLAEPGTTSEVLVVIRAVRDPAARMSVAMAGTRDREAA
ncbi:hypothetical protein RGF97_01245 [Streptomyces roseicoloratus]|uniref:Uncharacterized protein n=1 Tax=Streptomyces roseicoloratus TaxID=2508722 RepID=A0ABY9RQ03_9ACTN|nr:hypothetical protein [Streptomyces roseicoloratus]WMX43768.1 hypothetical protein RGF97_01245 [Streptomyces roseicoloratus]